MHRIIEEIDTDVLSTRWFWSKKL